MFEIILAYLIIGTIFTLYCARKKFMKDLDNVDIFIGVFLWPVIFLVAAVYLFGWRE